MFDGGRVTASEVARITLPAPSVSGLLGVQFIDPAGLERRMAPSQAARTREALAGLGRAAAPLLVHGQRAGSA
ncbi:hypothetical protein ACWEQL_06045 [Kitasatospora sp. NPDC004240]